jgi:hypothetical protein
MNNMKFLSSATLAATLLSYVAADISKLELHRRALKVLSARKYHALSRELVFSDDECMEHQTELVSTGINSDIKTFEILEEFCDIDELLMKCDYDDTDVTIDSGACASAGGRVVTTDLLEDCDDTRQSVQFYNNPICIHTTCDAKAYVEMLEDGMSNNNPSCDYDFSVSGAAIGSTSIITSVALLVSVFAMIW